MQWIIQSVIATLDKIEVRGKGNLDKLLGCIQTLEKLLETIKTDQEKDGTGNGAKNQPEQNV